MDGQIARLVDRWIAGSVGSVDRQISSPADRCIGQAYVDRWMGRSLDQWIGSQQVSDSSSGN